ALLRHPAGQAHRVGRGSPGRDPAHGARALRVQGGRDPHDDPGPRPNRRPRGFPRGAALDGLPRSGVADVRGGAVPLPVGRRHRRGARRVRAPRPPHDRRGAAAVGRLLADRPTPGVAVVKFAVTFGDTTEMVDVSGEAGGGQAARTLVAPLPGRIVTVAVKPGDRVEKGATLLVIEAMKMENEFKAGASGTVAEVRVAPGQTVNGGDVLIVIR